MKEWKPKYWWAYRIICLIRGHEAPDIGRQLIDGMILKCPKCNHSIVVDSGHCGRQRRQVNDHSFGDFKHSCYYSQSYR